MKKITFYQFMKWDGADRHYPSDPVFANKADADCFLGENKYDHFDKKTIIIFDSFEEYEYLKPVIHKMHTIKEDF